MKDRWLVFVLLSCTCAAPRSPAPPAESPAAPLAPPTQALIKLLPAESPAAPLAPPTQALVKLPPAERRGHISLDAPPTDTYSFKVVIQECLLEATSVEMTIRDAKGNFVYDSTRVGVVKFDNSTQSEWIEVPQELGDYMLERAVFRSVYGQDIYTLVREPDDSMISIPETRPSFARIIIVDCKQLQSDLEHRDQLRH